MMLAFQIMLVNGHSLRLHSYTKTMKQSGVSVSLDGHGVDEMMYGYKNMVSSLFYDALYDPKKKPERYKEALIGFSGDSESARRIDRMLVEKEEREEFDL